MNGIKKKQGPHALVKKGADMSERTHFAEADARRIGEEIGIDWSSAPFDVEQLRRGMEVELEHGLQDARTNVTDDDSIVTAKIALAHLNEFADYYTRLERMEEEAKRGHQAKAKRAGPRRTPAGARSAILPVVGLEMREVPCCDSSVTAL